MSPEQIRGSSALDERADIYSFGCVLYELFAGKLPFTATTADDLLNKHLRIPPPALVAANRDVTLELSELVAAMMAKKPEQRPRSMNEVLRRFKALKLYKPSRKT
jgi:serine/threonine protein kinase